MIDMTFEEALEIFKNLHKKSPDCQKTIMINGQKCLICGWDFYIDDTKTDHSLTDQDYKNVFRELYLA